MSEILAVFFASVVMLFAVKTINSYQQMGNQNVREAVMSQQHRQFYTAVKAYMEQNSAAIQAVTTPTTPAVISVAMLQAAGNLLPASFSATNPYQQTWQAQVLQPTPGTLQALVMSTGGDLQDDKEATKTANLMGAAGGFIPQNDSKLYTSGLANAYGAYAGWKVSTAGYSLATAGHQAALLVVSNGQQVSNYLYRNAVPGQPQLNQMATALDMTSNDVNNVATLGASTVNANAVNATLVNASKVVLPYGNSLQIDGSFFYGDSQNTAIRQNGDVYLQHPDGITPSSLFTQDVHASGTASAANVTSGNSAFSSDTVNTIVRQPGDVYFYRSDGTPANIGAAGDIYLRNGTVVTQRDYWAMMARDAAGSDNAQAQSANGSAYVNDVYLRSIGRWASELANNDTLSRSTTYGVPAQASRYSLGVHKMCVLSGVQNGFNTTIGNAWKYLVGSWNTEWVWTASGHTDDFAQVTCFD